MVCFLLNILEERVLIAKLRLLRKRLSMKKNLHGKDCWNEKNHPHEEKDPEVVNNEKKSDEGTKDRELIEKSKELEKISDLYIRLQADFENYKKRSLRDREEIKKSAAFDMILSLLPALDHFEIGLKVLQSDEKLLSGFKMILDQFVQILKQKGVQEINPKDEAFNPQLHEAVAYVHSDEIAHDNVIETLRKGYLLNDKLLRPATVVVSKGKQEGE